ncbi:hypothetical protein SAMN05444920_114210 [Nonomuraea solani]|uniref:Uncharacterized protein n=1 Tax=Nonomuraea solani TaxID=1144553 RepID=A0A1H6ETA3_9ACTN|nr:hypothetical protein [Nonomuraea solani]SEG99934.1 hypothetical protein SAMN05444920_114210 [Nonomuraea solani]
MNETLAGFEERRLAELKDHIAARAAAGRNRRPRRRIMFAMAAGAAAATVAAVATVTSLGGGDTAYAVTKDSDGIVHVTVRDFADAKGLNRQLTSLGVPALVDYVPAGQRCRDERGTAVRDVPRGLYHAPANIPGDKEGHGWQMRIDTKLFKPGQTFVWTLEVDPIYGWTGTSTILMHGPVAPCVLVPDDTPHNVPAVSPLRVTSSQAYEGKTVGRVRPEIEKRGLKVTYLVTEPRPAGDRRPREASRDIPYVMYPNKQNTPVGDDWFVWQVDEPRQGTFRLMVTREL